MLFFAPRKRRCACLQKCEPSFFAHVRFIIVMMNFSLSSFSACLFLVCNFDLTWSFFLAVQVLNGLLGRHDAARASTIPIGIIPAGSDNSLVWTILGVKDPTTAALAIVKVLFSASETHPISNNAVVSRIRTAGPNCFRSLLFFCRNCGLLKDLVWKLIWRSWPGFYCLVRTGGHSRNGCVHRCVGKNRRNTPWPYSHLLRLHE